MQEISKIQSISDIVTNSSSEVFLMSEGDANYYDSLENTGNCIHTEKIDWDWLEGRGLDEWEMICEFLDIDKGEISTYRESNNSWWFYGYWETPNKETWEAFLYSHKDEIEEKLIGLYLVEIEDHFKNVCDVLDSARSDSMWTESRH